ncbi:MAG: flagellin lysine-N-methylase [Bradymonadales bacterium]|nr:flagellin lysine-N-methylase [Bradymonadales bacterium]
MKVSASDVALRYALRFHCLADRCEDSCCIGWRVMINQANYEKIRRAASLPGTERRRFLESVELVEKGERSIESYAEFKMRKDGTCPMLMENRLCRIHALLGPKYLCHTCQTYPRRIYRVGDMAFEPAMAENPRTRNKIYASVDSPVPLELSATASCPEVARLLLLHEDAVEIVPFDRRTLGPLVCQPGIDLTTRRPYGRYLALVRERMNGMIRMQQLPLEKRLLCLVYLASRTTAILNHRLLEPDSPVLEGEALMFDDPEWMLEVSRQFDTVKIPAPLLFTVVRTLVKSDEEGRDRTTLRELTRLVLAPYLSKGPWIRLARPSAARMDDLHPEELIVGYRSLKERMYAAAPERFDRYFTSFAASQLFGKWQLESTDLLTHLIRLLVELAVYKFYLFSHPLLHHALDQLEAHREGGAGDRRKPTAGGETELVPAGRGTDDQTIDPVPSRHRKRAKETGSVSTVHKPATGKGEPPPCATKGEFLDLLDRVAVEVVYRTTSLLEHGFLLEQIERKLKKAKLMSPAGAVYLAKL